MLFSSVIAYALIETDVVNKCVDTKQEWSSEMNWEVEIDIYTIDTRYKINNY